MAGYKLLSVVIYTRATAYHQLQQKTTDNEDHHHSTGGGDHLLLSDIGKPCSSSVSNVQCVCAVVCSTTA